MKDRPCLFCACLSCPTVQPNRACGPKSEKPNSVLFYFLKCSLARPVWSLYDTVMRALGKLDVHVFILESYRGFITECQLPDSNFPDNQITWTIFSKWREETFVKGLCYTVPRVAYLSYQHLASWVDCFSVSLTATSSAVLVCFFNFLPFSHDRNILGIMKYYFLWDEYMYLSNMFFSLMSK